MVVCGSRPTGAVVAHLLNGDERRVGGLHYRRACLSISAALLLTPALLAAGIAQARDLVVYGEPTLEKALKSVGKSLASAHRHPRQRLRGADEPLLCPDRSRRALRRDLCARWHCDRRCGARQDHPRSDHPCPAQQLGSRRYEPGASAGLPTRRLPICTRLITGKTLAIANPDRDLAGARAADLLRNLELPIDDSNKSSGHRRELCRRR